MKSISPSQPIMGIFIIVLFYQEAKRNHDISFRFMWLAIILSFGFYIPVVLFADVIPLLGMLMIPKTCSAEIHLFCGNKHKTIRIIASAYMIIVKFFLPSI